VTLFLCDPKRNGSNPKWLRSRLFGRFLVLMTTVLMSFASSCPAVFAGSRVVDVQITDNGFRPVNVLAMMNQPIEIHVTNSGHEHHQFSIPFYRIYSRELAPGSVTDIKFSPWNEGQFDMMSDPSGDNKPEFRGWFIVEKSH
jgi:Cupredoxin-like domain